MATGLMSAGIMNSQSSLQQARESQLLQQMQSAKGPDQKEKIEKGAKEFEALLLTGWLQKAEESLATVPGGDDDDDAAGQQMMSIGVQSLAQSLANSGGIGIGAMIEKAMLSMAQKSESPSGHPPGVTSAAEIRSQTGNIQLNSGFQNADRMVVSEKGSE